MLKKLKVQVKNLVQPQLYIDYAQEKLSYLNKFLVNKEGVRWNVRLSKEGGVRKGSEIYHAEAQVKTSQKNFGAEADGSTPYEAIDTLKGELAKKITHHKEKRITKIRKGSLQVKKMLRGEK